jgi:hypothetical protein
LHIREKGVRLQGRSTKKQNANQKLGTKVEECTVMAKKSYSHEQKGQKPKGHLKKKAMTMKKGTMNNVAPTSYTLERTKGSTTIGGKYHKNM